MNTIAIVRELADERSLTFFKLSQICDVSHSTLKNSERRGGQLSVDTIERICDYHVGVLYEERLIRKKSISATQNKWLRLIRISLHKNWRCDNILLKTTIRSKIRQR